MEQHHQDAVDRVAALFEQEDHVLALILGGSLAHGFAQPDSDVDVLIVVDGDEFERRNLEGKLTYYNAELCAYAGGYIDGKYTHPGLLQQVAERGSDAARYAYKDCKLLFSRDPAIPGLLAAIARYPSEQRAARINRFAAQVQAWRWFYGEAIRKQNRYLTLLSVQKIVLFTGRIILAANDRFFPYHKWLLEELRRAERKPEHMLDDIALLLDAPSLDRVAAYCDGVLDFVEYRAQEHSWPHAFVLDSELNWLSHEPPVDDV